MNLKQHEAVILAMEQLGGMSTLGGLFEATMKIENCEWKTKTPFASIRRIVQTRDEFFKIKPGLWGLTGHRWRLGAIIEDNENNNSKDVPDRNHSYYQGIATELGNISKYNTYVPNQDKNKKYLNKTLAEVRTLDEIPKFSFDKFVNKTKTIDSVWFDAKSAMPKRLYEIEHSTDINNSLLKFVELQDFCLQMFIVANKVREDEFKSKLASSAFRSIVKRVKFLSCDGIVRQYEAKIEYLSTL